MRPGGMSSTLTWSSPDFTTARLTPAPRRITDLGAGLRALGPSFLGACQTPLLSITPRVELKSSGLSGSGRMAGVSAQPRGPWGLEPQDPRIWTTHQLGRLLTPRVDEWKTAARTLSWLINKAFVREYMHQLRPQVVGAAEPNTEGATEAGSAALEYGVGCLAYTPALRHVASPSKFQPLVPVKFEGKTNPKEFLTLYITAMIVAGANQKIMFNWFPMALKGTSLSWLMHLPKDSIAEDVAIIGAFMMNVGDKNMREQLNMRPVRNTHETWAMVDLFSLVEEGRLASEDAVREAATGVSPGATHRKKGGSHKCGPPQVLASEPSAPAGIGQKSQGAEKVVVVKPATKKWCPLHESDDHDACDCSTIITYAEGRKKRWAEQVASGAFRNCFRCNQPGHHAKNYTAQVGPRAPAAERVATGEETLLKVHDRGMDGAEETQPLLRTTFGVLRRTVTEMMMSARLTHMSMIARVHTEELTL
ncbi:hypothetical protein QYE76_012569 [Lolium multiflorum]|uniref:Uncharacterized protein n=1 Tax=Lolium multiflorum TaxID=4521 RepID=A0AAD8TZJ0_LOLMU|nr:hypothetical protein QYE76_012569 [Lolium multiflorum]